MKVIVVGAGINGVTAAIELKSRGHDVQLLDPGPLPHPLAASTDISKAVRGAYGPDEDYTELVERCVPIWRRWNVEFGEEVFHEVGFLFVRSQAMEPGDFEEQTARVFERRGRKFERFDSDQLRGRFPAWNPSGYGDSILEIEAGFAEAARVVSALLQRAGDAGVEIHGETALTRLQERQDRVIGVISRDGELIAADQVVITAGAWTPSLLPFTKDFLRSSGQLIYHLKPDQPDLFRAERFPVFGANISGTGYYGFPLNREGIVKIGNHGIGRDLMPGGADDRAVAAEDEPDLREFLARTFPALASAPIVHARVCMYCDTNDGDFWIARDPERSGLTIATGDNGHGFKFAPVMGELIADAMEGKENPLLQKFRWRPEVKRGERKEAARFGGTG